MCRPLTLCVKNKFEATWETIIFSAEIVEGKERGSGSADGDLLLGGLHLPCDMYIGLKAWIEIHFLASTLTLSPIARSHYCCTPTEGQCSKAPCIKPFVCSVDRSDCYSNSTSLCSYFSPSLSFNLSHSLPLVHAVSLSHLASPSHRLSPSIPTFPSKS